MNQLEVDSSVLRSLEALKESAEDEKVIEKKEKLNIEGTKDSSSKSKLVDKVRRLWEEYCVATSIHGVKYVGEQGRPVAERLWWLLMLLASLSTSVYFISQVYDKFRRTPIVVTADETPTPISDIPFPAVTICSALKFSKDKLNFSSPDNQTQNIRGMLRYACPIRLLAPEYNFSQGLFINDTSRLQSYFYETFHVSPPEGDWLAQDNTFSQVFTEEGVCFTFNQLSYKDILNNGSSMFLLSDPGLNGNVPRVTNWSLDTGYSEPYSRKRASYPRRTNRPGLLGGALFILSANDSGIAMSSCTYGRGFKIQLHSPADIPNPRDSFVYIPSNVEAVLVLKPNSVSLRETVKGYPAAQRGCYLEHERPLKHFRRYTQANCDLECLANVTLYYCGCVPITMPRAPGELFCGAGDIECVNDARDALDIVLLGDNKIWCGCLPGCTLLKYDLEISYSDSSTNSEGMITSAVQMIFKDREFTGTKRRAMYDTMELIAYCGGLLGLFCGMSLLGIVELVYFVTFRWWISARSSAVQSSPPSKGPL